MDLEDTLLMIPDPVPVASRVLIGCLDNAAARDSTVQKLEIALNKRGYIDSVGAGIEAAVKVIDKL